MRYVTWHLSGQKSGSVTSLNDGTLSREQASGEDKTSYGYPDPGWMMGVVGFGPNNLPDPARRVLTFTTAPLAQDLEIAGPIKLTLHASSTRNDMDFFVKLSEQMPQSAEDRAKGLNPASYWITKGWLRASHRALDPAKSTEMEPYHTPHRSRADRAGKNLPLRHQRRADGAPLQERQSHSAGNRQRRFGGHRRAVDPLLRPEQDRRRHDLPFGAISLGADLAGDGGRVTAGSRAVPPLVVNGSDLDRVLQSSEDGDQLAAQFLGGGDDGHRMPDVISRRTRIACVGDAGFKYVSLIPEPPAFQVGSREAALRRGLP